MAGRPTKCTPEVVKIICDALERGHYAETAAILAGVAEKTLYNWITQGEKGVSPFAEFLQATKAATAKAENQALARVQAGCTGQGSIHWTSAMTFLERRFPHKWGKRDPDHALKTKALEVEIETLKAKLKLLEAGTDPDAKIQPVFVLHADLNEEDDSNRG